MVQTGIHLKLEIIILGSIKFESSIQSTQIIATSTRAYLKY